MLEQFFNFSVKKSANKKAPGEVYFIFKQK
jgi:hypothetical protein